MQSRSFLMGKKARDELPISNSHAEDQVPEPALRRRLLSFSETMIRPLSSSSAAAAATLRRSMSVPSDSWRRRQSWSLRLWWDTCRTWVSDFVHGTGKSERETVTLGGDQSKSSWRRLFYRLRSRLSRTGGAAGKGFRYDSFSYAQNFDDGIHADED